MNNTSVIEENKVKSKYLRFVVGNDTYGLDIGQVREVIEYSQISHLTRIPMVHESILGVINLRGQIIPVIDISMRLYNRKTVISPRSSIIIAEVADSEERITVGAMIDALKGVENIFEENITDAPGFGTKIRVEFIDKIININDVFMVLLNIKELLNINELSELSSLNVNFDKLSTIKGIKDDGLDFNRDFKTQEDEDEEIVDEHVFVTLVVGNEIYGIDIIKIHEIINITKLSYIPNTLPFMKGVINLRGSVIPVIDMRERCGLDTIEYNKKTPILIVELKKMLLGLIIDSVFDVVKFPVSKIQHPPHYSAKIDSDFIDGLLQLDDKTIISLNVDKILSPEEHNVINNKDFYKEEQQNG
ncbi:MAG: chemotaxis protein CheW [Spirochaetes bacterium]|nr:chemotaxis protein CheW [Spirochaetota bacterium]